MTEEEKSIAILVNPAEYLNHLNSIVSITTDSIDVLVKDKTSKAGCDIKKIPLSECSSIKYRAGKSYATVLIGASTLLVIAFILFMVYLYWNEMNPGQRIPIGLLALGAIYALRRVLSEKRHTIKIYMSDSKVFKWKSKQGDFSNMQGVVNKAMTFFKLKTNLKIL